MTLAALNSLYDYACHNAKKYGFSIIPVKSDPVEDRKKPAVNWELFQIMRASQRQIDRWFKEKNPNHNLGVVTGSVSNNLVVFDVDSENGRKRIEHKRLEMSANLRVALDNTMVNKTGGGGLQIFFRLEEPIDHFRKEKIWTDGKPHSEIVLLANGCYVIMPPSLPKDPKTGNRYEWNGKDPQLITMRELLELKRVVGTTTKQLQQEEEKPVYITNVTHGQEGHGARTLAIDKMQQLLDLIRPYYIDGHRDFIIFYLSGMMRKEGYDLDTARRFTKLLCNSSGYADEDLEGSLVKVDRTYKKETDEVIGKKGLHEELVTSYGGGDQGEYEARCEAFSRICQIINGEPEPEGPEDHHSSDFLGAGDGNSSDDDDWPVAGAWLKMLKSTDKDLDPVEVLTKELLRLNHFKTLDDTKEILWYHNGAWRHGGENRIISVLDHLGRFDVKMHTRTEIIEMIRAATLTPRSEFDKDIYLVNCRNCIVDLRTGKAKEHDPKYLFTQQIPVDYRFGQIKTYRKILKFLSEVVHPSDIPLLIEFIGYCLIKNCRFQKALMCAGPPDQGKSTFLLLLEAFFGRDNISNKTMHQLTENRFATSALFGKLANIFADLSSDRLKDISMFNVLVAGDWISAEKKNRDAFDFQPFAKLIFSANLPPLPAEGITNEDAFYKRWFVVSFNLKEGIEIDRNLLEKITTDEELSGLLYLAIMTARCLIIRGRFSKNPSIWEVTEEYQKKANPVKAWASVRCIIYEGYETDKDRLEADFMEYCARKKLPSIKSRIQFGRELARLGVKDETAGSKDKNKHVWKGIALRKDLREKGQLDLDVWDDTYDEVEDS
jgi:P4 family phage/plasmid primase-like protien